MSSDSLLPAHIARAEQHLQEARQLWDRLTPPPQAPWLEPLELAIAEMRAAQDAALAAPHHPELERRLHELRGNLQVFGNLMDAAMAFYRGIALHTGMEQPALAEG